MLFCLSLFLFGTLWASWNFKFFRDLENSQLLLILPVILPFSIPPLWYFYDMEIIPLFSITNLLLAFIYLSLFCHFIFVDDQYFLLCHRYGSSHVEFYCYWRLLYFLSLSILFIWILIPGSIHLFVGCIVLPKIALFLCHCMEHCFQFLINEVWGFICPWFGRNSFSVCQSMWIPLFLHCV